MKAKLVLGPLSGFINIPRKNHKFVLAVMQPLKMASLSETAELEPVKTQHLVFELQKFDGDRCAIYKFTGVE